jgi:hypothetical protein
MKSFLDWMAAATLVLTIGCTAASAATTGNSGAPAKGSSARYYEMKEVSIVVHTADQDGKHDRPALHLLVPKDWTAEGGATLNQAAGGCFVDIFALSGVARSADQSVGLAILPSKSWGYIEDPMAQRQFQAEYQKDSAFHLQSCPLRKPVHAADYIRDDLVQSLLKSATVISVDPFPELDHFARYRLGLPADGTGNPGGVHTEAARAHVTFTDSRGQPAEGWLTAVILVRALQSPRGPFYDWRAIDVMAFQTPPGKLDAYDRLFKLMVSTMRVDPQWQQYYDSYTASLYRIKQQGKAQQQQMIAQFQKHAADMINGVTQRAQQGANNAAFGEDQIIRGVQTFRDPSTGATMELSNQYDHAWLNGGNQYVMSDDPNFNPNGNLSGNWTELQVVRPSP